MTQYEFSRERISKSFFRMMDYFKWFNFGQGHFFFQFEILASKDEILFVFLWIRFSDVSGGKKEQINSECERNKTIGSFY